jgi:hypothetical protein
MRAGVKRGNLINIKNGLKRPACFISAVIPVTINTPKKKR